MDASQLSKGTMLQGGKYRIESVLGQGGFGITYLATQELLDRKVAVKEFFMRDFCSREGDTASVTLGTASNRDTMERYLNKFLKEARTISTLDQPNIIHIFDIFKENNTAYYVMDYIEGESLSQMVKHQGALPESEAVKYIRAVADALKYVHERKINHLDVKPGNIMVRHSDHRVFLLDFGLSKQYDAEGNQTSSTPVGISHGYAPIEQYKPGGVKEFSPQTDIYALGATLYYLVTGIVPPSATDLLETELDYPETLSASVCNAIRQAMKVQKKERPKDIDAFLKLLDGEESEDTIIEQEEVPSSKPEKQKTEQKQHPNNHKSAKIVGLLAVLVLAIGGIYALFFNPTAEELYAKAKEAYNKKEYVTAFKLFKEAAEDSLVDAQYNLGAMYEKGQGITQNYEEAVKWYRKAAEQGNAKAQHNLGVMYDNGQGVSKDYSEAVKWFRKAAAQGLAGAQYGLGLKYNNGQGVTQDYSEAVKWYRKAAEQDYAAALYGLGNMYVQGLGVAQDYEEAAKLHQKAAEQGYAGAQYNLGVMYKEGLGVSKDDAEAVKWFRKAAEQDKAGAQYNLGVMYYLYLKTMQKL